MCGVTMKEIFVKGFWRELLFVCVGPTYFFIREAFFPVNLYILSLPKAEHAFIYLFLFIFLVPYTGSRTGFALTVKLKD